MREVVVQTQESDRRSGGLMAGVLQRRCACGATTTPGLRSPKSAGHDFTRVRVWPAKSAAKVEIRNNQIPGRPDDDPIHGPLLERSRGSASRVEGMPDLSDADLKYSGALGRMGGPNWMAPAINRRNLAEVWFNRRVLTGAPAGETIPVLNGQVISNDGDVRNAIPLPAVASRVAAGRTRCWFSSGVNVEGHSNMDILTTPPWTHVAAQPAVGARLDRESWPGTPPNTTPCASGTGTATVRVVGEKGDDVLEEYIRLGEGEHDAGYARSFDRNIGQLVANVNGLIGGRPELELSGNDLPTCTSNLMALANYDGLTTQFVIDLNAENTRIHAGNRHFTMARRATVDPSCTAANVTMTHGKL